jgi:SAM-dependent methyltransferase
MADTPIAIVDYNWHAGEPYNWSYLSPIIFKLVESLGISRVMDLGSGNGKLCGALAKKCSLVVGVEYDQKGVEIASRTYPDIAFYQYGVQDNPRLVADHYPHGFDAVISTEVIEHLYLPRLLPRYASAFLRPGGYLIVSTPYNGYLKNLALDLLNKWDHHHMPLRDGGHVKFWSRKTLEILLREEGYDVVGFYGAGRLPWLWKSMVLVARLRAA